MTPRRIQRRALKGAAAALVLWASGAGAVEAAATVEVPSGQTVELQEVLIDQLGDETWVRFRFLAPEISKTGGGIDYQTAAEDMVYLCETLALPYLIEYALTGDVIMMSMSDRPIAFGEADPDTIQFFEAFRPVDNTCIWEAL